ncbi:acyl-CoA thioesterase [Flavobacteriaceae bacterium]|nr:acyl-CoA thioesterase [Flavobacteriaceae bacterium]
MRKFTANIRVRYGETDQMGVVYHGNYATYFEVARTEWLRNLGVTYKSLEDNGIILPVISLSFNFLKSAKYDDTLSISVFLKKSPLVKIEFDYEIYNHDNEKISTGNSVLAFIDMKTNKPIKCPDYILEKLNL